MKYFITGATGYIGGRVTRQLVNAGHELVALARNPEKADHLAEMGVSIVQGDITDKESLLAPMSGVDGVFHIAAWYKVGARDKSPAYRINVEGTRNVFEAMKELDIKKGVYTSSLAVISDTKGRIVDETYRYDGSHPDEYNRTKWLAHYEVAEPMMREGLPLVIVLPGAVYGPGDPSALGATFRQYLQGKLPMVPKGTAFCWAHVDDIARGHILAMEKGRPGEAYIIAGPPHSIEEAIEIAERITGIKAPSLRAPGGMIRLMAAVLGTVGGIVSLPEGYAPERLRSTAGMTYLASDEKARRELGYSARPLEEGLQETLAHMMKELGISPPK